MDKEEPGFQTDDGEDETAFEDEDDRHVRRKQRSGKMDWYEAKEKLDRERTRRKARREKRRKGDLD